MVPRERYCRWDWRCPIIFRCQALLELVSYSTRPFSSFYLKRLLHKYAASRKYLRRFTNHEAEIEPIDSVDARNRTLLSAVKYSLEGYISNVQIGPT